MDLILTLQNSVQHHLLRQKPRVPAITFPQTIRIFGLQVRQLAAPPLLINPASRLTYISMPSVFLWLAAAGNLCIVMLCPTGR